MNKITNKDQLSLIGKLTKNKDCIKIIDSHKAFFYFDSEDYTCYYCFDKQVFSEKYVLANYLTMYEKSITVDNKNRIHCYYKKPIKLYANTVLYKILFKNGRYQPI